MSAVGRIVVAARWVLVALAVLLWVVLVPVIELGRAAHASLLRRLRRRDPGRATRELSPDEQGATIASIHEDREPAPALEQVRRGA